MVIFVCFCIYNYWSTLTDAFELWLENFLEKTLESPLESKIKPVNPKGNQRWIILWKERCWSYSSNTWATWCKQLTHWKRLWCWEKLMAEGEEGNRKWDGWMVSLIQWTWTWANSKRRWGTGKPDVLQSMELQRVAHDLATEQQHFILRLYKTTEKNKKKMFSIQASMTWKVKCKNTNIGKHRYM